jgi:hypothetical protein
LPIFSSTSHLFFWHFFTFDSSRADMFRLARRSRLCGQDWCSSFAPSFVPFLTLFSIFTFSLLPHSSSSPTWFISSSCLFIYSFPPILDGNIVCRPRSPFSLPVSNGDMIVWRFFSVTIQSNTMKSVWKTVRPSTPPYSAP